MNALWRLEQGGIHFSLSAEGQITWRNMWQDEVPQEWLQPLLSELRGRRSELVEVLKRRQEWDKVYDEWSELLATEGEDFERDNAYLRRLADLAKVAELPCYDGGQVNLRAEGWDRVAERILADWREQEAEGAKGRKGEGEIPPAPPLPFSPAEGTTNSQQKENDEMGIKIEQTTYDAVPTGDYKAVITAIEQVEGKFGPQLQIKSEINHGPYAGNTFLCWVSPKFSPKSRLYEWVEAALAMPVPKTYTFDSDHLIGREVVATLVVRELDGGGEVNRVDRVRAASRPQRSSETSEVFTPAV